MDSTSLPSDHFAQFNVLPVTYKTVKSHDIRADVLVPKSLRAGKHPVLLHFHGGGLITGDSLFPEWFTPWSLSLANQSSAIIVSPNHRLLPESDGLNILSDLEDFWTWIHTSLPSFLHRHYPGISPDLDRIMTAGESAGGYLSVQLGLSHPDAIRSVMASYPMLDLRAPHYTQNYEKSIFNMPQIPTSVLSDFVTAMKPDTVVSSDPLISRGPIFFSMLQQGRFVEYFGTDRQLFPLQRIEDGARLPRGGLFITHGEQDSVIPVEGSFKFVELVKQLQPDLDVALQVRPGNHGFDNEALLGDAWLKEGLKGVVNAWLA